MREIVSLTGIRKSYQGTIVLDDISLTLLRHETIALLGANGSGKSTLLRIVAGLTAASRGSRRVHDASAIIRYVPERFPKLRFTPAEYLYRLGRVQGMQQHALNERIAELLRLFRLEGTGRTWIRDFSKGMLQKVGIMQSILLKPDLLILDEPLSGLDIAAQGEFIELLRELKLQGIAMIFTCHEPELAEAIATRRLTLSQGKLHEANRPIIHTAQHRSISEPRAVIHAKLPDRTAESALKSMPHICNWEYLDGLAIMHVLADYSDATIAAILQINGSIVYMSKQSEESAS